LEKVKILKTNLNEILDRAIFKVERKDAAEFLEKMLDYHSSDDTYLLRKLPDGCIKFFVESSVKGEGISTVSSILIELQKLEEV